MHEFAVLFCNRMRRMNFIRFVFSVICVTFANPTIFLLFMIGVLFMKKVLATVLALGMTTLAFTACTEDTTTTTTGDTPVVTTTDSQAVTTTAPVETTTAKQALVFFDGDMVDNIDYGYYCKILRDENNEILGFAVHGWKNDSKAADLVIAPEYVVRDKTTGAVATYPVIQVGVGQGVISFQTEIETLTIPVGVTKVANTAFAQCTNLQSVSLPEGLTTIGRMAFWHCDSLTSVVIPSTVTEIGNYAFANCTSLKSVTLPAAFADQVDNIFSGCSEDLVITYN